MKSIALEPGNSIPGLQNDKAAKSMRQVVFAIGISVNIIFLHDLILVSPLNCLFIHKVAGIMVSPTSRHH